MAAKKKTAKKKSSNVGKKSAHKGGGYERAIASELSLWLTDDSTEDAVWRSASSGGRATRQLSGGDRPEAHVGDLIAVLPEAVPFFDVFCVECKRVKALQWRVMFKSPKCNIRLFWEQAVQQAVSVDKQPLLIMREDNGVDLVALTEEVFSRTTLLPPFSVWCMGRFEGVAGGMETATLAITPLVDLLNNDPDHLIRAAKP